MLVQYYAISVVALLDSGAIYNFIYTSFYDELVKTTWNAG